MKNSGVFDALQAAAARPEPWTSYTIDLLWDDPHVSKQMLAFHLDETAEPASRNRAFIDRSVEWIASRFGVGQDTRVCDFGCGPGLYTTALAKKGARVTGIDLSRRSIAHASETARQEGLDIEYQRMNYLDYAPNGPFDLITLIYCDFCPLSPGQRKKLLGTFHRALAPGGAVLMDVSSAKWFDRAEEKRTWEALPDGGFWSPGPHHVLASTFKYPEELLLLDKYLIFENGRTREVANWFACFSPETLTRELAGSGFAVTERLGNVAGDAYSAESTEFAVIFQKA